MLTKLEKATGQDEAWNLMVPDYPDEWTGEDEEWNYASKTDKKWRLVTMKCNTDIGHLFEFPTGPRGNKEGMWDRPTRHEANYLEEIFDGLEIRIKSDHVNVIAHHTVDLTIPGLTSSHKPAHLKKRKWSDNRFSDILSL
jgi:hypothetical protein